MNRPTLSPFTVLLIGGISGVGKSTVAEEIGKCLGIPWLQVDDLRLALQRSQVQLPTSTDALYFFMDRKRWFDSPEAFRDGLIGVGEVMKPSIEAVINHHDDLNIPIVIEGDGILPSLLASSTVQPCVLSGRVKMVILTEPDEGVLLDTVIRRGRIIEAITDEERRVEVRAKGLFGHWLAKQARHFEVSVISVRPWETLADRIWTEVSA